MDEVRECTDEADEPPDSSIVSSHEVDSVVSCLAWCGPFGYPLSAGLGTSVDDEGQGRF